MKDYVREMLLLNSFEDNVALLASLLGSNPFLGDSLKPKKLEENRTTDVANFNPAGRADS